MSILTNPVKVSREAAVALHLVKINAGLNESLAVGHIKGMY